MCLLLFAYNHTPGYRLVLAANRDEFLDRPTAPLSHLDKDRQLLAGRDLQAGGTWLGVTRQGKLAAITNYRDPAHQRVDPPSRGEILTTYLQSAQPAYRFLTTLANEATVYNGFNLLIGDREDLYHFSNITGSITKLEPGLYGLSNHLLDTPWPKVTRGKNMLKQVLEEHHPVKPEAVFSMLADQTRPPDTHLPNTGVGLAWERLLSSMFITSPVYGTRSSAVVTIDTEDAATFTEQSYQHDQGVVCTSSIRQFSFHIGQEGQGV